MYSVLYGQQISFSTLSGQIFRVVSSRVPFRPVGSELGMPHAFGKGGSLSLGHLELAGSGRLEGIKLCTVLRTLYGL